MDEEITEPLDDLADKYESAEQEQTDERTEKPRSETQPKPDEGAENIARLAVTAMEMGWRSVDGRVKYEDQVYTEGREKLGPLFAKYGLGASTDRLPASEELAAGWWLGSLAKRTWLGIKALWEDDQKRQRKQDQQDNGNQRESAAQESSYPVPGEIGAWEEPVSQTQSPYTP